MEERILALLGENRGSMMPAIKGVVQGQWLDEPWPGALENAYKCGVNEARERQKAELAAELQRKEAELAAARAELKRRQQGAQSDA